jgi:hypothetical protein
VTTYTKEELRRPARISRVFRGKEDRGVWTVVIHLEAEGWGAGLRMPLYVGRGGDPDAARRTGT